MLVLFYYQVGFTRRRFLKVGAGVVASWALAADAEGLASSPFRIAFGSCNQQWNPQPIWPAISSHKPDLFLFLGDNVYADTDRPDILRAAYKMQREQPAFRRFRESVPIAATWDDHDFGFNDSGREFGMKEESKRQFLDFFDEPVDSERRKRPGVYTSHMIQHFGQRIQVILLDLRWFRSPLKQDVNCDYVPNYDPEATILGEAQWAWLEAELDRPADVRLLGSSIQFASDEHRWEKWANFPLEKARLLKMIDTKGIDNLSVLSGDMHFGELTPERTPQGRVIYDLTSSGLNRFEAAAQFPNSRREMAYDRSENFGLLTIHRESLVLAVCDREGVVRFSKTLLLPVPAV